MTNALIERSEFATLRECVYLNQASLGLLSTSTERAMSAFIGDVARHGNLRMTDAEEVAFLDALRREGARLFHCPEDQVAILSGASELLGQLPLMLRPQPESQILAVSTDFPAVTRPWLRYGKEHDCEVLFAADLPDQDLTDTLIEHISDRTEVVCVSNVQFATGSLIDVVKLRKATAAVNARLIIDATQAAGVVSVDANAWQADVIVTSGYKWLGGHGGVALAALSNEMMEMSPVLTGWMSAPDPFVFDATALYYAADARRFTGSTMSYVSIAGLTAALEQCASVSAEHRVNHAACLARQLIEGTKSRVWRSFRELSSAGASPHIVALTHPEIDAGSAAVKLREKKIICGSRNGNLRVSLAPYNNGVDIALLVDALNEMARSSFPKQIMKNKLS